MTNLAPSKTEADELIGELALALAGAVDKPTITYRPQEIATALANGRTVIALEPPRHNWQGFEVVYTWRVTAISPSRDVDTAWPVFDKITGALLDTDLAPDEATAAVWEQGDRQFHALAYTMTTQHTQI